MSIHPHLAADTDAEDIVHVTLPRRVVRQDRQGVPVIYWGAEVLRFDEPALAPLADAISAGLPFSPMRSCPLAPADRLADAVGALTGLGILGDRAETPAPRSFTAPDLPATLLHLDWRDPAAVGGALLSSPIAPAHLELVVPVFRIAHLATDADGRQVGEANVFPRALRRNVETDWQTCTYAGTRHRDDKPMNLTALKAMRAHWPEMMATLAAIRDRYMTRAALAGPMTLGQIERLCIAVLSLPTWHSFKDAPLHPVLSSLFRVTDGLRIVVHQMMFVGVAEPMLPPDAVISAAELFDYAERSLSFHSDSGVCAGPEHFIREFLSVLVDGAAPRFGANGTIGADVAAAMTELDVAMDYGFTALAAHAACFAVWPEMAEAWAEIVALAEGWPSGLSSGVDAFRLEAAEAGRRLIHASYLGQADWREMRRRTYAEIEGAAVALSRQPAPRLAVADRVVPTTDDLTRALAGLPDAARLQAVLARFAASAGAHLSRAAALQARISDMFQRPPAAGFTLADMTLHARLVDDPHPRLQFLPEVLFRLCGLELDIKTFPAGDTAFAGSEIDVSSINQRGDEPRYQ
ncbi:hypothetical protein [Paragemmobacter straminiformis]|uniref:Uncharacterized protein n=1 Tax=Paragemmobacter straminiformis TaxID=2045119 RepID=A0A842I7G3_9RHOB|nr:hypothetical protein [Gemmobacter straminiformis]MBC2835014.1 hypothetical protein [Gemmobacter straminiformis]